MRDACDLKVRHASREDALEARRLLLTSARLEDAVSTADRLGVYRCNVCGGYHLGKRSPAWQRKAARPSPVVLQLMAWENEGGAL